MLSHFKSVEAFNPDNPKIGVTFARNSAAADRDKTKLEIDRLNTASRPNSRLQNP